MRSVAYIFQDKSHMHNTQYFLQRASVYGTLFRRTYIFHINFKKKQDIDLLTQRFLNILL